MLDRVKGCKECEKRYNKLSKANTASNINSCDTCNKKFKCGTQEHKEICPFVDGKDLFTAFIYYNNICTRGDRYEYRISNEEIFKLIQKAKFRTVETNKSGGKHNINKIVHLEVVE